MHTTIQFMDAAKVKLGVTSDYALAPHLNVTRSQISRYRNEKDFFSDEMCVKVASILEIDEGIIAAACHAERAKSDGDKRLWMGVFEKLGGVAALLLIATGLNLATPSNGAASEAISKNANTNDYANIISNE